MIYDDDFCCCTICKQRWYWTEHGWMAVPDHYDEHARTGMSIDVPEDPYEKFKRRGQAVPERGTEALRRRAQGVKRGKPKAKR